ncbi:MAG: metal-dependent hydrolase [Candidatus Helarchaeota archaeon]|nr:metal-dependent hydrolase [Candidatus Helarchaeota archaeon]
MPEVLIHLLIPAAALIIAGFDRKIVLYFAPFAMIHDIDIFFGIHRSGFHSLLVLGLISLVLLFYTFKYKPQWKSHAIIISFLLLSHPLMDLITGYVQLFWPFDTYFWLEISAPTLDPITTAINFSAFYVIFHISPPQDITPAVEPMPLFENQGLIAIILIGLAMTYWLIKSRRSEEQQNHTTIRPTEE